LSKPSTLVFAKDIDSSCGDPCYLAVWEASIPFLILDFYVLTDSYACATSSHEQILLSYGEAKQCPGSLVSRCDRAETYIPDCELYA